MKAPVQGSRSPKILFIDAYDSFSNNIIALLRESLCTAEQAPTIEKITIDQHPFWPQNDQSRVLFRSYLSNFDAVVAGPGPGNPANANDVGLIATLWSLPEAEQLPVLGICLGFQSMCLDAGATVIQLSQGRHGIVTELNHCNKAIFSNVGHLQATHYHSLHVNIDHPIQTGIGFEFSTQLWEPSLSLPRIVPLAWDCSPPQPQQRSAKPYKGAILMAAEIKGKPRWGVQYHPESICSGKHEATLLIANWWKEASAWVDAQDQLRLDANDGLSGDWQGRPQKRDRPDDAEPESPSKRVRSADPNGSDGVNYSPTDSEGSLGIPYTYAKDFPVANDTATAMGTNTNGKGPCPLSAKNSLHHKDASSDIDSDGEDDPPDDEEELFEEEGVDDADDTSVSEAENMVRQVPPWYGGFRYSSTVVSEKIHVDEGARERSVQHVRDIIDAGERECVILESGQNTTSPSQSTGRFSIIGLVDDNSIKICYFRAAKTILIFRGNDVVPIYISSGVDFTSYWKNLKKHFRAEGGNEGSPFWGGSFLCHGYEACLDTIGANLNPTTIPETAGRPDAFAVLIFRSVVIDHFYHDAWVQSIAPYDGDWVFVAADNLRIRFGDPGLLEDLEEDEAYKEVLLHNERGSAYDPSSSYINGATPPTAAAPKQGAYVGPSQPTYEEKVQQCQNHIAAGDSYELCLTGQTQLHLPKTIYPRHRDDLLYRNLSRHNPAPFGARIRLALGRAGLTIFSSSPERFLCWDRGKKCEFRPIKGTLRKSSGMTKQDAVEYFKSTKERAENLMITDLIRHDLYGVLQLPGSVRIPEEKLFAVEEYSTVYQLVTGIEGRFRNTDKTGIDVLNASLPPGSMTGAPKKRSCELLQQIEEFQPRGLYSGVIGYDDVGGGGDFSVLIRAAVRWDGDVIEECDAQGNMQVFERWTVGAGGAVTALSDPTDEFREMELKRSAVLRAFAELPGHSRSIPGTSNT